MGKTTRKISRFLRKIFHKPTVEVGKDRIILYLSLIFVVFVAFFIRLFPILLNYPVIKAFDPWFQYHIAEYVTENGYLAFFTWIDPKGWYPWGNPVYNNYIGTPFLGAALYQVFNFFGLSFTLYETVILFPVIMGTLTTIMMYYLGKTIGNRKVGILAAFFLSICPAYVQRTIAGFYDNETIGVFLMVTTLYLFIKGYKEDSVFYSVMGGFSVGFFMWSWGAWVYIVDLIPLMAVLLVLMKRYSSRLLKHYSIIIGLGLLIGTRIPGTNANVILGLTGFVPFAVLIFLICCEVFVKLRANPRVSNYFSRFDWKRIIIYSLIGIIALVFILGITGLADVLIESDTFQRLFGIQGRLITVLNPLVQNFIIQSVGEHLPSPWGVYYYNLHILIFVMPIGFYYLFKRGWDEDVIIILFGITTLYFAGSLIRLLLILGPAASLIGAYGIVSLMRPFSLVFRKKFVIARRRKRHAEIISREVSLGIAAVFSFLIITTSIHGIYTTAYQLSGSAMVPGGQFHDWEECWSWMKNSLSDNAVVTSWWDYGYWITVAGNKTTSADNGTWNSTQIAMIGRMMMATDPYDAVNILRRLNSTHVLVYWGYYTGLGGDEGKWVWMVKIGHEHPELNPITYSYNISDYYNDTDGKVGDSFFESTIWQMLVGNEYYWTDYNNIPDNVKNGLWGNFESRMHKTTDMDGDLWNTHVDLSKMKLVDQSSGMYLFQDPEFFTLDFMSTNHLVKVYKINYDQANLRGNITNVALYNSGISYIDFENIGYAPCEIDGISIAGNTYDFDMIIGNSTIEPGENVTIRAYGPASQFNTTQTINITIKNVNNPSVTNDRTHFEANVTNAPSYNFDVNATETYLYSNNTAIIPVNNTGDDYIKITSIDISKGSQNYTFRLSSSYTDYYGENGTNGILNKSEHTRLIIPSSSMSSKGLNLVPGDYYNITLKATNENITRTIESKMVVSPVDSLTVYDIEIYGNETLKFKLMNTGQNSIKIKDLKLSDYILNLYSNPVIDPFNGYVIESGDLVYFNVTFPPSRLNLNYSENYYLNFSLNTTLDTKSNETTQLSVAYPPGFTLNVTDDAFSNETLFVTVNNTGNYSVTISDFWINNYPTTNFNVTSGGDPKNFTLSVNENKNFTIQTQYNMNYTNSVDVKVRTFEGIENQTSSFVNYTGSLKIDNSSIRREGFALVNITNNGTNPIIIQSFTMISGINKYQVIEVTPIGGDMDYVLYPEETQEFNLTTPTGVPTSPNYIIDLNVSTYEGAYTLDKLTWAIGFDITNIHAYENGTLNITILNNGQNNITFSNSSSLTINGTLIGNLTLNGTANLTVMPGEICNINVFDMNYTLNNFSKYILVNISANYTETERIYISPNTENNLLLILSEQASNLTIYTHYPDSLAFDNGTLTKNDTIMLKVMNTGSQNLTISNISLYNDSMWLIFNFTDETNHSISNLTLQPYEVFECSNATINNNETQDYYIELNVTKYIPISVNCTNNYNHTVNLMVLNNSANLTIQPENTTFASDLSNEINMTLTNYGDTPIVLTSVQVNGSEEQLNGTNLGDTPLSFRTINPGETKIYLINRQIVAGDFYEIKVYTNVGITLTLTIQGY
ncbi:MAG: STT3 domain-containing protein [Candidatus Helarchaeota archaeon]